MRVFYTPASLEKLPRSSSDEIWVVIDVLRATSTILAAFDAGVKSLRPVREVESAREWKRRYPEIILAGERGGLPPDGFELGNSPREWTKERLEGREVVMTTTNGTRALEGCQGRGTVVVAAWRNRRALCDWIRLQKPSVNLICAGTGEDFSLEDALVAGAIAEELAPQHPVASIYRANRNRVREVFRQTKNGKALIEKGLEADIDWCLDERDLNWIPILNEEGLLLAGQER